MCALPGKHNRADGVPKATGPGDTIDAMGVYQSAADDYAQSTQMRELPFSVASRLR